MWSSQAWCVLVIAVAMLAVVRPIALATCARPLAIRTGTAALVGEHGRRASSRSTRDGGRIKLKGEVWSARTYDPTTPSRPGKSRRGRADRRRHRARLRIGDLNGTVLSPSASSPRSRCSCSSRWPGPCGSCRRPGPASWSGSAATHAPSTPGLAILVPFVDRLRPLIDLREQVVSFPPQPVITADNLVVGIDTVLYFQVTDAKAATYEIANYIQGVEQLTVTTLRNVVGNLNLEQALTSRDHINDQLARSARRGDRQVGHPGQPGRDQGDRPADLHPGLDGEADARRPRQARRDPHRRGLQAVADPHRRGRAAAAILKAEGDAQAAVLRADGEAQAIQQVFDAIHAGNPDQKLLAYQYLQMLPQIAQRRRQQGLDRAQRARRGPQGASAACSATSPATSRAPPPDRAGHHAGLTCGRTGPRARAGSAPVRRSARARAARRTARPA